jgi:ferredoxin--NADP+ reductase
MRRAEEIRTGINRKGSMTRIVSTERLAEHITAFEVESPEIVSSAQAGQIVLTRIGRDAPWIPKAVVDPDRERGVMTLLVTGAFGGGPADGIECDLKGPYGTRKSLGKARKILFVAERDGLGAILPRLHESKAAGLYTMIIAGYRSQGNVFWTHRLDEMSDEFYVVTDDGSYGIKGPIRHTLRAVCEQTGDIDRVHAAGSLKLLRTTTDVTRAFKIPATVSLAAIFDEAAPPTSPESAFHNVPGADEAYDWEHAIDLDAHATDFDALARRFGILVTR